MWLVHCEICEISLFLSCFFALFLYYFFIVPIFISILNSQSALLYYKISLAIFNFAVSKIRENIYKSLLSVTVISDVYRSFIE